MRAHVPALAVLTLGAGLAGLLAGCAEPAATGTPSGSSTSTPAGSPDPAGEELMVVLDRGDGTAPERYTLSCAGPAAGDHPDAAAACAHLAGLTEPFTPLPDDAVCTEQYGGPQTARVTGRWQGEDVELELSRIDGCHISQWEALGPLIPPVSGVGGG